ncbi:unnamed protein product [Diatraea saccharalis]|uniref:Peptidase S1 domain-containing protein n=1 Tax=Diatraea saccharalis TaxID=40085 RepID=A0A9N9RGR3_9NEOP|nr:unnamed protein product [Diatraea saccharalis]
MELIQSRTNMHVLIALVVILAVAAGESKNLQRIVGGTVASIGDYPEIVALLFSYGNTGHTQTCGGVILNNRSILTAAHCTIDHAPARWQTRAGSADATTGGTVYLSSYIINHGLYDRVTFDNDISIIRTATGINFGAHIQPGSFAGTGYILEDNQVVWAAGWGATTQYGPLSADLQHVQVWTVNQAICAARYAEIGRTVTTNMLCSGWLDFGGRDQCQGDNGGPLYHNRVVVGVSSWRWGCAQPRFPSVNTRVSNYISWLQDNA